MCLYLTSNSARLRKNYRRRKTPVIAYKIVYDSLCSPYRNFQWSTSGKVKSNRRSLKLTIQEKKQREVYKGFHFYMKKPEITHEWRNVLTCEIQPKDIVAVGRWTGNNCLVATKCSVLKAERY